MTDAPTIDDIEVLNLAGVNRERVTAVADRLRRVAAVDRESVVFDRRDAVEDALATIEDLPAATTLLAPLVADVLRDDLAAAHDSQGRELSLGGVPRALHSVATRVLTTSLSYGVILETAAANPALSLRPLAAVLVDTLQESDSEDARQYAVDGVAQLRCYCRELVTPVARSARRR
jgi:hypothetical protein